MWAATGVNGSDCRLGRAQCSLSAVQGGKESFLLRLNREQFTLFVPFPPSSPPSRLCVRVCVCVLFWPRNRTLYSTTL